MERASEPTCLRIQAAVVDLHLVSALDRRSKIVAELWRAKKNSRIVVFAGDAPDCFEYEIIERLGGLPKQPRPFACPGSGPSKAAAAGHPPVDEARIQQLPVITHAYLAPLSAASGTAIMN